MGSDGPILHTRNVCEFHATSVKRTFRAMVLAACCRGEEARVVRSVRLTGIFGALAAFVPSVVLAQVTPAAGFTPPDDTPSIRVGVTLYTDYTYQQNPQATDSDGNTINPNSFNVT